MMSLTFGLFTQVSGSGPLGPLVVDYLRMQIELRCMDALACFFHQFYNGEQHL